MLKLTPIPEPDQQNPGTNSDPLANTPQLKAYLARVGATTGKSFRKFVVKDDSAEGRYGFTRRVLATITIKDGKPTCNKEAFAPTADEIKAIESELAKVDWPKSIPTTIASLDLLRVETGTDELFVFHAQTGGGITFVQQRRIYKDDGKHDLPWSFWSDGKWRCMEPDEPLPSFGLDQLASGKKAMIHEGAKVAAHCQWLTSDDPAAREALAAHPWGAELSGYVHLGWPGGALNPHRVDWDPIRKLPAHTGITVVCDNDQLGKEAITPIARALIGKNVTCVMFDDAFPAGFDLADPFPKALFKGRRWVGPRIEDCLRSATWATEVIQTEKSGRPAYKIRAPFLSEWAYAVSPPLFVNRNNTTHLYNEREFNTAVRPFSNVEDTARILRQSPSAQVDGICYEPSRNPGVVSFDGARWINTWTPTTIKPLPGNVERWLDFIRHLIPDETDAGYLLRWCATLIARPAVRMKWAVLLISEVQGVGKTTLAEKILRPLVGSVNVSTPSEREATESSFNAWIARKRLVCVHEIYAGHSWRAYHSIKSLITEDVIRVNEKFLPHYELRNHAHFICASNSMRALNMAEDDRRWFVPAVTSTLMKGSYWVELNAWLRDDGLNFIHQWALDYAGSYVGEEEHAPPSASKDALIAESIGYGEKWVLALAMQAVMEKQQIILTDRDVRAALASLLNRRQDEAQVASLTDIRKRLTQGGMKQVPGQRKIEGVRSVLFANRDVEGEINLKALWENRKQNPHELMPLGDSYD